ncbi:MAG: hypothetical protein P8H03_07235, partial [Emcibacteraceae bacterium]|nr:hypothetical protein [Emcibacteraceae bacterium]
MLCGSVILLSGCSTIDGFIGGGLNDPTNMETTENANSNVPEMAEDEMVSSFEVTPVETFQSTEDMLKEKDQALISQGMRLAVAEKALMAVQEEKSMLQQELDAAKKATAEKQAMLDQQSNVQALPMSNETRVTAPNGG